MQIRAIVVKYAVSERRHILIGITGQSQNGALPRTAAPKKPVSQQNSYHQCHQNDPAANLPPSFFFGGWLLPVCGAAASGPEQLITLISGSSRQPRSLLSRFPMIRNHEIETFPDKN